jgi:HD-GYP domain-containing protein (c-di-GMP phosphodiesterase class II)
MFDRVKLRRDLTDCGGRVLARAGTVISVESIAEAAASTRPGCVTPLSDTFLADDLAEILRDPALRPLIRTGEIEKAVRRVVESAKLPQPIVEEMAAAKLLDPARYRHALSTAAVTTRLILAAAGTARASPQIAAAALLHDIGMRHVPARVMATPGAFHLACAMGSHPAVEAALAHHWRDGQGYPDLAERPSPTTEVVAVSSAYSALTQGRAYRSEPFGARGAADLLVAEAASGHADPFAVKLLVHALRGGEGAMNGLRFARARQGIAPDVNRHTRIAPPARRMV